MQKPLFTPARRASILDDGRWRGQGNTQDETVIPFVQGKKRQQPDGTQPNAQETAGTSVEDLNTLWLVCFTGREESRYWWDRIGWTSRDFRHCYIMQYQAAVNKWILMDWRTGLCDLVIFRHHEMTSILNHIRSSYGRMVMVKRQPVEKETLWRFPVLYCVQAVLQVLGLSTGWTFTPYQLYKRLIRLGGEELINYRGNLDGFK